MDWKERPSMQLSPSSGKSRQPVGSVVLPRVPTFGPASQLSPEVLVSSMAEGSLSKGARRRVRSVEPRSGKGRLGDTLPSLPAQRSARGARDTLASMTAAKGLWSIVYKYDHPDISFRDENLAFPEGGAGHDSPSFRTLSQLSSTPGWEELYGISESRDGDSPAQIGPPITSTLAETASPKSLASALPTSPRLDKVPEKVATDASAALNASSPPRRSSYGQMPSIARSSVCGDHVQRNRDLHASFHLDLAAVEMGHINLHRFQNTTEMEMRSEAVAPEVNLLAAKFEKSGIAARPQRTTVLEIPGPDMVDLPDSSLIKACMQDEDDFVSLTDGLSVASSTEISTCTAMLNFYRWLCGLPPVRLCSARLAVCNIVSICLLARCNAKHFRMPKEAVEFTEALGTIMNENGSRLSVIQGEASLVSAVDRGTSSMDAMILPPGVSAVVGRDPVQLARDLIEEVDAGPVDIISRRKPGSGKPMSRSGNSKAQEVRRHARADIETASPLTSADNLPEPLQPMRVLWDVAAQNPSHKTQIVGSAPPTHASQPAVHKPQAAKKLKERHKHEDAASGGLSTIWGDRDGALSLRRCLLSPALREFGAARRQDTCVMWTSSDQGLVKKEESQRKRVVSKGSSQGLTVQTPKKHRFHSTGALSDRSGPSSLTNFANSQSGASGAAAIALGAVCWPPAGFVPLTLLESGRLAWTIMPDSARFQPTASTNIRMWRVQIDRPPGGVWSAERQSEVAVRACAVDCSSHGEPFCVVFWPELEKYVHGAQFEVLLEGLRGETTSLTFYYEFRGYLQQMLNESLCKQAAAFRDLLGDRCFWGEPRDTGVDYKAEAEKLQRKRTTFEQPQLPVVELVSYQEGQFSTNSVDVTILLKSAEAATISAHLYLLRFSGEEEMIPCGTQVSRLGKDHFLLRAKMPMSRCRFELRLMTSTFDNPKEMFQHPVKYLVSTSSSCQTLLSTMEDTKWKKFGLVPLQPVSQRYGVFIFAPYTKRIEIGTPCFFLIYVNKSLALSTAAAEVMEARKEDVEEASFMKRRYTVKERKKKIPPKTLFKQRLMCDQANVSRTSSSASGFYTGEPFKVGEHVTVHELQKHLWHVLHPHTQDSSSEIVLDIALRSGEVLHRLRERPDFPGFFEGFFNFEASDVFSQVRLYIRFPQLHSFEYAPRKLAEWLVCRNEHFPLCF